MKITKPTFKKLEWLLKSAEFKKRPLKVGARMVLWEWYRYFNKDIRYKYDDRFDVILRPNEGVSRLVYYFGVSEPELFSFYAGYLAEGMTVLDVGANIGLHSLFMANRVGIRGKVYAFEPCKNIFGRLQKHVSMNTGITIECINCAVGREPGSVVFHENINDTSRSYVSKSSEVVDPGTVVALDSIDSFIQRNGITSVDLLKVDVEGFENDVIQGSMECLKKLKIKVLQIELDNQSLSRNSSNTSDIVRALYGFNYCMAKWNSTAKKFEAVSDSQSSEYNTFFVARAMLV